MKQHMKIGSVQIDNFTVFAPLAGITHLPLRLIAKEAGCGLVYSEMISSNGLIRNSLKTTKLLESSALEKPLSIQLFGSDPDILAEAAQIAQSSGANIIDLNFGCSVKKILKSGSGSMLMKDPQKVKLILKKVEQSIDIPLTIKIRSGWHPSGEQALKISQIAQDCGISAIAIHPRTATQGFQGFANWEIIKMLKQTVSIPIIGNGDIITAEDAIKMLKETNCDYVMVGRAAVGNPLIFKQITDLHQGRIPSKLSSNDRISIMIEYLKKSIEHFGETTACYMLRSRLCWFVKGMKKASTFRKSIRFISSGKEAMDIIQEYAKLFGKR